MHRSFIHENTIKCFLLRKKSLTVLQVLVDFGRLALNSKEIKEHERRQAKMADTDNNNTMLRNSTVSPPYH